MPARYVARWDGGSWSAVGTGMNNTVMSVAVAENTLFAGGIFTMAGGVSANRIAQWDGTSWSALGSGISPDKGGGAEVRSIATWGTNLFAAGNIGAAGGKISYGIARAGLLERARPGVTCSFLTSATLPPGMRWIAPLTCRHRSIGLASRRTP